LKVNDEDSRIRIQDPDPGSGSGSISQRHGSAEPDPPQNVMDPQHCLKLMFFSPQFFVFLVIILIAEICAGVLLYFQKGTLETLIGRPRIISSFQRF
jgi:hypothetical protein